jgi:hypothetical protein
MKSYKVIKEDGKTQLDSLMETATYPLLKKDWESLKDTLNTYCFWSLDIHDKNSGCLDSWESLSGYNPKGNSCTHRKYHIINGCARNREHLFNAFFDKIPDSK